MYPCYAPSLGVTLVAVVVIVVLGKHVARGHLRGVELAAAKDARRRVHHWRPGGVEAVLRGVHGGGCVWCLHGVGIVNSVSAPAFRRRGVVSS